MKKNTCYITTQLNTQKNIEKKHLLTLEKIQRIKTFEKKTTFNIPSNESDTSDISSSDSTQETNTSSSEVEFNISSGHTTSSQQSGSDSSDESDTSKSFSISSEKEVKFTKLELNKNSKTKVHILNFWGMISSHIEIILEETLEATKEKYYYRINAWSEPKSYAEKNNSTCLKAMHEADEISSIEIDANLTDIIQAWQKKYKEEEDSFNCLTYNCADISAWFLDKFVNIKQPALLDPPVTVNYACCCVWLPSFFQCFSLPGRVYDYAKIHSDVTTLEQSENTRLNL